MTLCSRSWNKMQTMPTGPDECQTDPFQSISQAGTAAASGEPGPRTFPDGATDAGPDLPLPDLGLIKPSSPVVRPSKAPASSSLPVSACLLSLPLEGIPVAALRFLGTCSPEASSLLSASSSEAHLQRADMKWNEIQYGRLAQPNALKRISKPMAQQGTDMQDSVTTTAS